MPNNFAAWLVDNLTKEDTPSEIKHDPIQLQIVPLAMSPLFNEDACRYLLKTYKEIGLTTEDYDGSTKVISWKGPAKVHVKGSIHGFIRAIYAKLSMVGVPYGYSAYSRSEDQSDINPMNMLIKSDNGANELRFESHYFPFIPQNKSSPIGMFGTYSIPSVVNTMMLYRERDSVLRLQHLIDLTTYRMTQGDTIKSATALKTTRSLVYDSHDDIRERVSENIENTTSITESELLTNCVEHIDTNRFASVMTKPVRVDGKIMRMHRIMWSIVFGNPDFSDKQSIKICRNRNCLNPFHFKCE